MTYALLILLGLASVLALASIGVNVWLIRTCLTLTDRLDEERTYTESFDNFLAETGREVDESYRRAELLSKTHVASDDVIVRSFVKEVSDIKDKLRSAIGKFKTERFS